MLDRLRHQLPPDPGIAKPEALVSAHRITRIVEDLLAGDLLSKSQVYMYVDSWPQGCAVDLRLTDANLTLESRACLPRSPQ